MSRILRIMITGFAFLAYIYIGLMIPWAFAAGDVDLVITPAQPPSVTGPNKKVSFRSDIVEAKRGEFLKIKVLVRNLGKASSGPFDVGIYLSSYQDGRNSVHEFDIIKNNVDLSGSEQISISEEYLIPYKDSVYPGRNYFVVIETDYGREVSERDENKRKVVQTINVPCDRVAEAYGDEPLCREHD